MIIMVLMILCGGQVDVNNIPTMLIDRVEVINIGGAAVYGSDACLIVDGLKALICNFNFLNMLDAAATDICCPIIALANVWNGVELIVKYCLLSVFCMIFLSFGSEDFKNFLAFSQ